MFSNILDVFGSDVRVRSYSTSSRISNTMPYFDNGAVERGHELDFFLEKEDLKDC